MSDSRAVKGRAEHVRSAQVFQTSTCSAIARASSTSMPRYRTVLPGAQQLKQMRRKHHVAVLVALALFDPDHHALAVDVGYLQRDHLGHTQSGPIGHTQCRLVFEPRRRIEKTCDFFRAQDDRQLT